MLKINRKNLLQSLKKSVLPMKSYMPILSHVLLRQNRSENLEILGSDLEVGSRSIIKIEEGSLDKSFCVSCKLLIDILSCYNDDFLYFDFSEESLILTVEKSKIKLFYLSGDDFPNFENIQSELTAKINLPVDILKSNFKNVLFAADKYGSNLNRDSVFVKLKENNLKTVATDSRRLAISNSEISYNNNEIKALIGIKGIENIGKFFSEDGNIDISFYKEICVFNNEETGDKLYVRKLDSDFVDYFKILVSNFNEYSFVEVIKEKLVEILNKILIFYQEMNVDKIEFSCDRNNLKIFISNKNLGEFTDQASIKNIFNLDNSKDFSINPSYLLEAIKSINTQSIKIGVKDSESLIYVLPSNIDTEVEEINYDDGFFCVIAPIKI